MGGTHDSPNSKYENKKKKLFVPIWRPISTQSGAPVAGTSVSLSSGSMNYVSQSTNKMGEESMVSSCEVDNLSERREHPPVSEAHQQIKVMDERMHASNFNKDDALLYEVDKHSVSLEVDSSLIRFIKGKGDFTQKQIEGETGVKITFPSSKEDNYIVIQGNSEESLTKASEMITGVLKEAVESRSLDYSHFISLPLAIHPELLDKLQKFQNDILGSTTSGHEGNPDSDLNEDLSKVSEDEDKTMAVNLEVETEKEHVRVKIDTVDTNTNASSLASSISSALGIDKSIFIKPKTFHLTVLMLKLWNKERVATATEVLKKISSQVNDALGNRPLFIRLKGVKCMRGSPAKARILYAPVEEIGGEGRLLCACQVITKAFVEAGLVLEKDAHQTLKLHATLMNLSHRKSKKGKMRHSFDARGIFLRYGSENWGDYLIKEAHLSQRFVFDEAGYYHCCASIPFPESSQID